MKKDQKLPKKNVQINNSSGKPPPDSYSKTNHNPPIEIDVTEDHQIREIHKTIHKIDIADQTVKRVNTEKITTDQTRTEVIIQTIKENDLFQTLGFYTIPMTVQEVLQTIEIGNFK